jgi:hypothetical protein
MLAHYENQGLIESNLNEILINEEVLEKEKFKAWS